MLAAQAYQSACKSLRLLPHKDNLRQTRLCRRLHAAIKLSKAISAAPIHDLKSVIGDATVAVATVLCSCNHAVQVLLVPVLYHSYSNLWSITSGQCSHWYAVQRDVTHILHLSRLIRVAQAIVQQVELQVKLFQALKGWRLQRHASGNLWLTHLLLQVG